MAEEDALIQVDEAQLQHVINQLNFLDSMKINQDYLVPAIKKAGSMVRKVEIGNIPTFSGKTKRSISTRTTTNGIGSVTGIVGPSKKRAYIFNFISGGARWQGRGNSVSTWRGLETKRNQRAELRQKQGRKANSSYLPAPRFLGWVKGKLGVEDSEAIHVAFAVAKTIGKRGLPAKPIVPPTLNAVTGKVIEILNEAISRMVEELGNHVK